MTIPAPLRRGSVIGITCPAGYVSAERTAYCVEVLGRLGYACKLGKTVGNGTRYLAGTDDERLADLQAMLDDPEVDAVLMGRGGYGMSRIIDRVDFSTFLTKPKWLCGFSDITVLHSHVHAQLDIATLHSPMCGHFKPDTEHTDFMRSFYDALVGKPHAVRAPAHTHNRLGIAEGLLTGGNLALMTHVLASRSEVDTRGKILFVEDVGEYLYGLDRMMTGLRRAGKLEHLAGIVFGGFTDLKDTERPFDLDIWDLLYNAVADYRYPVAFGLPVGHADINYTLMLGGAYRLAVSDAGTDLTPLL